MHHIPVFPMTKKALLALTLITLVSGAIGAFMLERDHGWGDDFAAYIMQARSITTGRVAEYIQQSTFTEEASNYTYVGPITVPWGFPLMLAPVIAVFGTKILVLKFVLTLSYMMFLIVFLGLAGTRLTIVESLLLTAVLAFNPSLLRAQNEILSDIPFLLFSTLALLLIELHAVRTSMDKRGGRLPLLIGLIIFAAALTRLNGFLLLLPLGCAQFIQLRLHGKEEPNPGRGIPAAVIPYLVVAVCYVLQALILPGNGSVLQALVLPSPTSGPMLGSSVFNSLETVRANLAYYFWLPGEFTRYTVYDSQIVYVGLLIFAALCVAQRRPQDVPMLLYGLATMALYVLTGGRQGIRYVYPVLPILLLFSYQGMKQAVLWLGRPLQAFGMGMIVCFWIGLAITSLVSSTGFAWKNMAAGRMPPGRWWGAYSAGSAKMFDFVRHHTPPDSVMIFFKPRAMRLLTDRNSFMTLTCDNLPKGDYVISIKDGGTYNQIAPQEIETCNPSVALTPVYDKDDWVIYKISTAP